MTGETQGKRRYSTYGRVTTVEAKPSVVRGSDRTAYESNLRKVREATVAKSQRKIR
ncbi:hypothetical protein [Isoptericola croceus]|uniref:hypothetical protein n=1 Tax=Isoptericola croceus TaxID=3031406 RepID=UPI0023F6D27C|nr:hypothetical protein [Isoptericola croceus]